MTNFLKKIIFIFAKTSSGVNESRTIVDKFLKAENPKEINERIIELDNHICKLCLCGEDLSKLNNSQKVFYYNQEIEREVNNGGFNQFYFNSSGNYAHEIVESLDAIGANKTAELVRNANGQFPNGIVPIDRGERQDVLVQIKENAYEIWNNLDQEFYKYEEDLNTLHFDFVKKNCDDFK